MREPACHRQSRRTPSAGSPQPSPARSTWWPGWPNTIDAPTLFRLGVKRVSLGGSLARAALSLLERAGRELLDSGTLGFLDGAIGYADLQRRFGS